MDGFKPRTHRIDVVDPGVWISVFRFRVLFHRNKTLPAHILVAHSDGCPGMPQSRLKNVRIRLSISVRESGFVHRSGDFDWQYPRLIQFAMPSSSRVIKVGNAIEVPGDNHGCICGVGNSHLEIIVCQEFLQLVKTKIVPRTEISVREFFILDLNDVPPATRQPYIQIINELYLGFQRVLA